MNSHGLPWTRDGFGSIINRVRNSAGIFFVDTETGERTKKHLHDLRGTFCTKLIAVAGLTNQEVAEIMGWSPDQVAGIRRTYVDQGQVNMAMAARIRSAL